MSKVLPPLTDPKRILSLAQNIQLCVEIKGMELDDFEAEVDLKPGTIKHWLAGKSAVTDDTLRSIAAFFGLRYVDLMGTQGALETRRSVLEKLLDQEITSEAAVRNFSRRREDVDVDDVFENPLPSVRAPRMANSQTRKESPATSNEEISWDETGTIACIKGRYIDLIKKEVRGAVAENIFYHNPHKPMSKFTNLLRPRRHANWLYNLKAGKGKITKDDLEQIASLCKTSVHVLLGGA